MINDVAVKLQRQSESGREQHIVWNQNSVQLVNAAKVKLLTHVQTKNNRENAAFKKLSSKVNEFMNGIFQQKLPPREILYLRFIMYMG